MNISEMEVIAKRLADGYSEFMAENGIDPENADIKINTYYIDENGVKIIPTVLWVDGEPVGALSVAESATLSFQALLDASGQTAP